MGWMLQKFKRINQMQQQGEQDLENTTIPQSKKFRNEKTQKQYKISIQLISETSLDQTITQNLSQQQKIEAVIQLKSIHLEWLNIRKIENLQVFTNLNILYLQHNKISKIQHLDCLSNLEYLALNDNLITKVENLKHLSKLAGLNLNNNQIEQVDAKQLPLSLQLLSFKQNPVCLDTNYRVDIVRHLPIIQMLDDSSISPEERLKIIGKFPQHLIEYAQKMKQFRNKQKIKKQLQQQQKKQPIYFGDSVNQSDAIGQIREKTKKFLQEAQSQYEQQLKEQNENFEAKIKISRKVRDFKKQQNHKKMQMSQINQTNEEHTQEN